MNFHVVASGSGPRIVRQVVGNVGYAAASGRNILRNSQQLIQAAGFQYHIP